MRFWLRAGSMPVLVGAAVLLAVAGELRAQGDGADWPCVQRVVPQLSMGQVWTGPEAQGHAWQTDPEIAGLAVKLVRRGTSPEEASTAVDAFALAQPEAERAQRLALLARAVVELVNGTRAEMIGSIRRYARRQQALAERISKEGRELAGLPPGRGSEVPTELVEAKEQRDWDLRIYEDRQTMLRQLCEEPVLMEQRAFMLGRMIAERLK